MANDWDIIEVLPASGLPETAGDIAPRAVKRPEAGGLDGWEVVGFEADVDKARYNTEVGRKISALKSNPSTAYLPARAIENIAKGRTVSPGSVQGGLSDLFDDVGSAVSNLPLQTKATLETAVLGNCPEAIP